MPLAFLGPFLAFQRRVNYIFNGFNARRVFFVRIGTNINTDVPGFCKVTFALLNSGFGLLCIHVRACPRRMNTESTPIRSNHSKTCLEDVLAEITPIRVNRSKKTGFRDGVFSKSDVETQGNRDNIPSLIRSKMQQSQKRKKNLVDSGNVKKKPFGHENKDTDNVNTNESDIFSYSDNVAEHKCKIDSFCLIERGESEKVECKNEFFNDSVIKISQILSVSDVMKWSDDSLIAQDEKFDLSNQIRKKLLENASIREINKTLNSGWTQLNGSDWVNLNTLDFQSQKNGSFYGLPSKIQKLYEEQKNIKELYSWQKECLSLEAVKLHKNLVYALPTSGGKTLVAEMLILRELLCYNRNVLFILPFVSIVQEKIKDFSMLALELGFLVEEYAAGKGVIPPRKRRRKNSVIVATIEKALVVINSLIETNRLTEFGLIVVDELHLLSDEGRGPVLETLLTQVLYFEEKIQIIGMTATIGNLREIADFLKAESYTGNFRPVHLSEYVRCGEKIYEINWESKDQLKEVRVLRSSSQDTDPDGIAELVMEVIPNDSVLIFCPTKKNCENVAALLCRILPRDLLLKHKETKKESLYRALISETNDQICPVLKATIPFGIAYHHSGLTAGERKLLEESFRDGTLSVICCTSTLAAGVNLPAKRVILRSPYVGKDFISLSKYKQMVGRAGRTGFGSEGESFLVCDPMDYEKVENLLRSQMEGVTSKMNSDNCKDLILSAIGLGIATSRRTLRKLLSYSLLHAQASMLNENTNKIIDSCISSLYKEGALKVKFSDAETEGENSVINLELNTSQTKKSVKIVNDSLLVISRLGRAAMKGGLSLQKAHDLYSELVKAQSSLVLLTSLHLLYLVTPYDILFQIKPNFSVYFNVYMQLDSKEIHTAKILGITEFVMSKLATGIKPKGVNEGVTNRFYVSLILNELWKQQTIWDVANLFQLPRGLVQTLMTSASTFANSVLRFCEELEELWCFKSLLTDFAPRLAHCCSAELLPLMDLPAVKRGRAKQLYDAGFKTLSILACAKPSEVVRSVDHLSIKIASEIIAAAKLLLMEKAENLKEEADDVLEGLAEKSVPKET